MSLSCYLTIGNRVYYHKYSQIESYFNKIDIKKTVQQSWTAFFLCVTPLITQPELR